MFRPVSLGTRTECVLALSTLHIWISCSCKPGAKWETWRATVSWVGTPQETKCTQFLALPVEIRLLLLFVAHFFFFFSHLLCIINLSQTQYCLLAQALLSVIEQVQSFMPEFQIFLENICKNSICIICINWRL